jgi:hypothetical protein
LIASRSTPIIEREVTMMIRTLNRALLISAAVLAVSGAYAQSSNASATGKANAAEAAKGAGKADKGEKADKADKGDKKEEAKVDPAERETRKAKEHDAQKEKLRGLLKAPVDEPLKQELRRHAERLARLERIKTVATQAKDTDSVDKVTKLLTKENERHDKWMSKHVATETTAAPTTPPGTMPAAAEKKGAAQ